MDLQHLLNVLGPQLLELGPILSSMINAHHGAASPRVTAAHYRPGRASRGGKIRTMDALKPILHQHQKRNRKNQPAIPLVVLYKFNFPNFLHFCAFRNRFQNDFHNPGRGFSLHDTPPPGNAKNKQRKHVKCYEPFDPSLGQALRRRCPKHSRRGTGRGVTTNFGENRL